MPPRSRRTTRPGRSGAASRGEEENILPGVTAEPGGLLLPEDEPALTDDRMMPQDEGDAGGVSDEPLPPPEAVFEIGDVGNAR